MPRTFVAAEPAKPAPAKKETDDGEKKASKKKSKKQEEIWLKKI